MNKVDCSLCSLFCYLLFRLFGAGRKDHLSESIPMKQITDELYLDDFHSRAFDLYFGDLKIYVFDIETTGLDPRRTSLILSGILEPEQGHFNAIQYFMENPGEEDDVILRTLEKLREADCVLTYNGRRFDLPFLETRMKRLDIPGREDLLGLYNLDLYPIIRNDSPLKEVLGSLRQKNIEYYMGVADSRYDEIDGGESVRLFLEYLDTHSPALEQRILLHNHDDIIQLRRILPVLLNCDLHRAMFRTGFPAAGLILTEIRVTKDSLHASARTGRLGPLRDYIAFPTESLPVLVQASSVTSTCEFEFPARRIGRSALVLDASSLLGFPSDAAFTEQSDLASYPAFQSGYLVLKQGRAVNYLEINAFLIAFLKRIAPELAAE